MLHIKLFAIGPSVEEKKFFKDFFTYMDMAAMLVMCPNAFVCILIPALL